MENVWWVFAIFTSFLSATYFVGSQAFKMHGRLLMVYRGFLVAFLVLPLVVLRAPIKEPLFYLFCSLQGFAIAFNDNRFARASKAFGAEVTSVIQPISISIIFVMWLIINPKQIIGFIDKPLSSIGIIFCLLGISYSIIKIRNSKASKVAFMYLLPVLFLLSVGDILNKKSMFYGKENLATAIIYYAFITGLICGTCNLFFYIKNRQKIDNIFKQSNLRKGLLISTLVIILMAFKNLAMFHASNPAYASAVILLSPIWIILGRNIYVKLRRKKTGYAHVRYELVTLLLSCVIGLVLLSN